MTHEEVVKHVKSLEALKVMWQPDTPIIKAVDWALSCLNKADQLCNELHCPAMEHLNKNVQDAWSSLSDDLAIPKTIAERERAHGR
jgi:hypothetical protein